MPSNLNITTSEGAQQLYTAIFDLTNALWACRASMERVNAMLGEAKRVEQDFEAETMPIQY